MRLVLWFLAVLIGAQGLAVAQSALDGLLTANDRLRLDEFNSSRLTSLREAEAGAPEDLALLKAALAGEPLSISDKAPNGGWKCRVMKLGGILPLTVYPQFRCVVRRDGAGWAFEKITGSQRTKGQLHRATDTRLIYLGSGYVQGDSPKPYGSGPESDEVAVVEMLGEGRLVFQFPKPYYESHFDILVLERGK